MMRKLPRISFVLVGIVALIIITVSVFSYVTHQLAAKPDISQIKSMVTSYYNKKGVWAGQYVIQQIGEVRSISQDKTKFTVCVAYQYAYPKSPTVSQGRDRRTFLFEDIQNSWQVTNMGGYLSC